jgi:tripartite ATP-independent transporter DctM subunit
VEWWVLILAFFGLLIFLLALGMPVAFSFLTANFLLVGLVFGLESGIDQLVRSMYDAVAKFALTPIPLFIILGEVLYHSGLIVRTLDALSKLLGRLPGRLSLLSVGSGTLFAALSGSTIANTSMLGSLLVPEMRKRGYHITMSAGPILASGTLAILIPPSAVAVLLGSIGNISIGGLLIAGIVPGLLLAVFFAVYIILACLRNPSLAPAYEVERVPWGERLRSISVDVLPLGIVVFLVVGLIFAGIATPTEAAALGALGAFVLVIAYRRMNARVLLDTMRGTLRTSGMIMLIFAFSAGFSQLLAFTGATRQLITVVTSWQLSTTALIVLMLLLVMVLGCFLEQISIMLITLPLFMPIVDTLGINPIWFGIMMLIALDLGNLTPPFGFSLFVMKGVLPRDVTMGDVYRSALPFITIEAAMIFLVLMVPPIALWLPGAGGG